MSNKKTIYLVHQSDILKRLKMLSQESNTAWIFFSRDYNLLLTLQQRMPPSFKYFKIADILDRVSQRLRRPYIDYIGYLGKKFDSLEWWTSRIAEKNTAISPLFLYICYIEVFKNILKNEHIEENDICILSESHFLLKVIYNLPEVRKKYHAVFLSQYGLFLRKIRFLLLVPFRIFRFFKKELLRKFVCFLIPPRSKPKPGEEYIFIRTWVSQRFIVDRNKFYDAYFGSLSKALQKKGFNAKIVPIIYSVKKKYSETIRWFRENENDFLIPDDFYSFCNLFQAVFIGIRQFLMVKGARFEFNSQDVTPLFYEELCRTAFSPILLEFSLYYYFVKNLRRSKISIKSFIFTFENVLHEKSLIIGLKAFYPETKIVGYQHSILYPMLLCQYVSWHKDEATPLPDRIVCCGETPRNILSQEGFSSERLVLGPALRYDYLYQLRDSFNHRNHLCSNKKKVLVAGMEDPCITLELLTKVYLALKEEADTDIRFIPHPNMKKKDIDNLFKKGAWGQDFFKIANGKMNEFLPDTDCLIAISTGAIFDALCLGIPVIRLRRETDIIIDPADWLDEDSIHFTHLAVPAGMEKRGGPALQGSAISTDTTVVKPWSFKASSPSGIKEAFCQIKGLSSAQRDEFFDIGGKILRKFFSPITDESYNVFV